jgi:hypothetical protein
MAWKRRKLASSMDRAIEVMNWTHYALAPGLKSESGVDPVKIISSGRGSCWDYCCILNELLDREGYKVTWISMVAEGHPCGCGPRQRESHEVLEVEADGRLLVLDPTTNNCLPYGFLDLLREPALAQHKFLLDEDYRSRRFHLYDTQEWFSRVVWYKLRVGVLWKSIPVRRRRNPYSLERATPAAVLHSEDLTTRKPEISR